LNEGKFRISVIFSTKGLGEISRGLSSTSPELNNIIEMKDLSLFELSHFVINLIE
jgi:hypothetical protein